MIIFTDKGEVFTWGLGEYGALGHGDGFTKYSPVKLESFAENMIKISLVSCGSKHTAFVTSIYFVVLHS